jgi:mannose-1-phosphate guanylyltransferase
LSERRVAVILCGGRGTRLAPYTAALPKPLVPVGNYPIIDILARQLVNHGFRELVFSVGHLAELIAAYFSDHELKRNGVDFRWVREKAPLGTAGSLTLIEDLPDRFLALNGDVLTTLDFRRMFEEHSRSASLLTIASHRKTVSLPLGVIDHREGLVTNYSEKPVLEYDVSMGVYGYTREAVDLIPRDTRFDLPDLVHRMLTERLPVSVFQSDAAWLDIGNPDDYSEAQRVFEADPGIYLPS